MTDDDLATRLRATGPLPATEVARILSAAADVVDRRIAEGRPHGRISPAAIVAPANGDVVLADPATLGRLPETGAHAAPEIIAGAPADARSEVFSLASTAYSLLTGTTPNSFGIANARRARPDLGPGLEAALTRATSRDPAFRYQSAGDFARALADALAPAAESGPPTPAAEDRPRRISALGLLSLIAGVLAVVSVLLWGGILLAQNLS
ncbi:hypothetical protein [Tsukamurella paurometabola]|uniref:Serine/threonine-protein kinase pknF n=1 Tax=Tsukamurella paurometabola TaxID=2061 RepID=A0A3P8KW24_TSUPA|nr:hypothetical protein [Tsukamurella paurometabola]UEA84338.1 hypothetical protein LK411_05790 [Tsukamurella paurometabola]VDR41517.1 Serine/threonine-protein kinase pknF [Tsukamurella paurometabola]